MVMKTVAYRGRLDDLVDHLERPRETSLLRVLEAKAAAGETAISVTSAAMRACGGGAFSKHLAVERLFRDAHAGAVMAPTVDVLREFVRQGGPGHSAFLIPEAFGDPIGVSRAMIDMLRGNLPPWRP